MLFRFWPAPALAIALLAVGCAQSATPPSPTQPIQAPAQQPVAQPTLGAAPTPAQLTKVKFQLDFRVGGQHAFAFVAQEKGFYRDAGLDVEIQPGQGSGPGVKTLGAKTVEYSLLDSMSILLGISAGACVQSIGVNYHENPFALFWREEAVQIKSLQDLKGKKVGAVPGSATTTIGLNYALRQIGTSLKDFQYVSLEPGNTTPILTGQIDVMPGFFNSDPVIMRHRLRIDGRDARVGVIRLSEQGLKAYGLTLATHCDTVQNNPQQVKNFVQASLKGLAYSAEHPEESNDILMAKFPELTPNEGKRLQLDTLIATLPLVVTSVTREQGLGFQDEAGWAATLKSLNDFGPVEKPIQLDVKKVFSNVGLPGPKIKG